METHPQPGLPDILKNTSSLPPPTPAQGTPFSNNPSSRSTHLHPTSQQSFPHWSSHNTHLGGPWGGHRPPIMSPWLGPAQPLPCLDLPAPRSSGHLVPSSRSTHGLPPDSGTGVPAVPTSRRPGTVQPAPCHPRQPTCRLGLPLHHKPTPPHPHLGPTQSCGGLLCGWTSPKTEHVSVQTLLENRTRAWMPSPRR